MCSLNDLSNTTATLGTHFLRVPALENKAAFIQRVGNVSKAPVASPVRVKPVYPERVAHPVLHSGARHPRRHFEVRARSTRHPRLQQSWNRLD